MVSWWLIAWLSIVALTAICGAGAPVPGDVESATRQQVVELVDQALMAISQHNLELARQHLFSALRIDPNHFHANNLIAAIHVSLDQDYSVALGYVERAFAHNAVSDPGLYANYVEILRGTGQLEKARAVAEKVLIVSASGTYEGEGVGTFFQNYALVERNFDVSKAFELAKRSIQLNHKMSSAYRLMAELGIQLEHLEEVEQLLVPAVRSYLPDDEMLAFQYGVVIHLQKRLEEALAIYKELERKHPTMTGVLANIATVYQELGLAKEAVQYYERVISLLPDDAGVRNNYGALLGTMNRKDQGLYWLKEALRINPNLEHALINLAGYYQDEGELEVAKEYLQRAHDVAESKDTRHVLLRIAMMVSPVSPSWEFMVQERKRFVADIRSFLEDWRQKDLSPAPIDKTMDRIHFYIAYHGQNDRPLQELAGRAYLTAISDVGLISALANSSPLQQRIRFESAPLNPSSLQQQRLSVKYRIGFMSKFFGIFEPHGMLLDGVMRYLPKHQFEIVCLFVARTDGKPIAPTLLESCNEVHEISLSYKHASEYLQRILLDVLVFADVVSEPMNHFLEYSRFAPIQIAFWGNPITTGSPFIDYFISADIMEHPYRTRMPISHDPYNEQVVLIEGQGIWYFRPVPPEVELEKSNMTALVGPVANYTRADFNLSSDWFIFLLPQSVFKIHPLYDLVLAEILRRCPAVHLVVTGGRRPAWSMIYLQRLRTAIGQENEGRLHMIERVSSENFYSLIRLADAVLHPFPFDGSRTSADALLCDVPYVTLPTEYLRGRMGFAFLRTMNIPELVAADIQEYVSIAARLAHDRGFYTQTKAKVARAIDLIWEDMEYPYRWTRFLQSLMSLPLMTYEEFLRQTGRSVIVELARTDQRNRNTRDFDRVMREQTWMLDENGTASLESLIDDPNIWPRIFEYWRNGQQKEPPGDRKHQDASEKTPAETMEMAASQSHGEMSAWMWKFKTLLREKRFAEALQVVETIPSLPLNDLPFLLDLGIANFMTGDYEKAFQYCFQYAELHPNDTMSLSCIGVSSVYIPGMENTSIDALYRVFVLEQQNSVSANREGQANIFSLTFESNLFNLLAALLRGHRYDDCIHIVEHALDIPAMDSGGAHLLIFSMFDWSPEGLQLIDRFEAEFRGRFSAQLPLPDNFSFRAELQRVQRMGDMPLNMVSSCLTSGSFRAEQVQAVADLVSIIEALRLLKAYPPLHPISSAGDQADSASLGAALIVQYFEAESMHIQGEVDFVLVKNQANPAIKDIYLLTEEQVHFTKSMNESGKLHQVVIGQRMTFRDAFAFANQHFSGRVVIIANADIYFDHSLLQLTHAKEGSSTFLPSNYVLALQKWMIVGASITLPSRTDSQDSWIFRAPISQFMVDHSNFKLGVPRCDNHLAALLRKANYTVINPAFDIRAIEVQRNRASEGFYSMKDAVVGDMQNIRMMDRLEFR